MSHARVPHRSNRSPKHTLVRQLVRHNLRSFHDDVPNPCIPCGAP